MRSSTGTPVSDAVKFNMADRVHRLSLTASAESTEPESDEEIQRILDERHSKNTTKATKNALKTFSETVGDVQSLTSMQF